MNAIEITISGPVQCGKSAVLQSIREMLDAAGYCVVPMDPEHRYNPPENLANSAKHERPDRWETVIVLRESHARSVGHQTNTEFDDRDIQPSAGSGGMFSMCNGLASRGA